MNFKETMSSYEIEACPFIDRFVCLLASVHGPSEAAPDARQAPAGPNLPATRPPETHPPLHLHSGIMSGPPLDPQVYCGCHHLPSHGEKQLITARTQKHHSSIENLTNLLCTDLGVGCRPEGDGLRVLPARSQLPGRCHP